MNESGSVVWLGFPPFRRGILLSAFDELAEIRFVDADGTASDSDADTRQLPRFDQRIGASSADRKFCLHLFDSQQCHRYWLPSIAVLSGESMVPVPRPEVTACCFLAVGSASDFIAVSSRLIEALVSRRSASSSSSRFTAFSFARSSERSASCS